MINAILLPRRPLSLLCGDRKLRSLSRSGAIQTHAQSKTLCGALRGLGLKRSVAEILSKRSMSEFHRIEETVRAVVDNLMLFDITCFELPHRLSVEAAVRNIFSVGATDLGQVVAHWKQLVHYMINIASKAEVRIEVVLDHNNTFTPLLFCQPIADLLTSGPIRTHGMAEKFAHLITTRNMPAADKKKQDASILAFRDLVSKLPDLELRAEEAAFLAARQVGQRLAEIARSKGITNFGNHISLSNSASLEVSVRDGGRAKIMKETFIEWMSVVPTVTATHPTPFGPANDIEGIPRWRSWCRNGVLELEDSLFLEQSGSILEATDSLHGLDEVLGQQLCCLAYLHAVSEGFIADDVVIEPPRCRVMVVPEPGFKARTATTSEWWVQVLLQSVSHGWTSVLALHPSAQAGLEKADQAWQFLSLAEKLTGDRKSPTGSRVLSTDLKTATDAIPKLIARALINGFCSGFPDYRPDALKIVTSLICANRIVTMPDGSSFEMVRGCLMGEPCTKVVLTILNLAAEEKALREFLNWKPYESVGAAWRCYAVAGDNQTAIGPVEYLRNIQDNLDLFGCLRSLEEDRISRNFVIMTEKILLVPQLLTPSKWTTRSVNESTEGYTAGPFVDSVKVRLLSPVGKSTEVRNDHNTAIGKGISLGGSLGWMNQFYFPKWWIDMVRRRFLDRMGAMLPKPNTSLYYQLMLPRSLGGLGLHRDDDLADMAKRLPIPTKYLLREIAKLQDLSGARGVKDALRILSALPSNSSFRGYGDSSGSLEQKILDILDTGVVERLPMWKAKSEIPNCDPALGDRANLRVMREAGWLPENDILDLAQRGKLWLDIFMDRSKVNAFNTMTWRERYRRAWSPILTKVGMVDHPPDIELSMQELKDSFKKVKTYFVYFVDYKPDWVEAGYNAVSTGQYIVTNPSLRDEIQRGKPRMKITLESNRLFIPDHVRVLSPDAIFTRGRKRRLAEQ
jgi:hypothetical protein